MDRSSCDWPAPQPYLMHENTIAMFRLCFFLAGLVPSGENGSYSCPPHRPPPFCIGGPSLDLEQHPTGCTQPGLKAFEQRNEGQWVRVRMSGLILFCHEPAGWRSRWYERLHTLCSRGRVLRSWMSLSSNLSTDSSTMKPVNTASVGNRKLI